MKKSILLLITALLIFGNSTASFAKTNKDSEKPAITKVKLTKEDKQAQKMLKKIEKQQQKKQTLNEKKVKKSKKVKTEKISTEEQNISSEQPQKLSKDEKKLQKKQQKEEKLAQKLQKKEAKKAEKTAKKLEKIDKKSKTDINESKTDNKSPKVSQKESKTTFQNGKKRSALAIFLNPNLDVYEIRASHILVKKRKDAVLIRQDILNGEITFEEAARKYSLCPSGVNGGDLGYFNRRKMEQQFADTAFDLKIGEISKPVGTKFGWHIIKTTDKR